MFASSIDNRILTGTAMLNAIWDVESKDVLDALMPFFRYAVGKETRPHENVSLRRVTKRLNRELGYDGMPSSVVETALKRLARSKLLTKHSGKYRLEDSLDEEIAAFEERRTETKASHERVGSALAEYLNEHELKRRFDSTTALNELTRFFGLNGLMVSRDPDAIEALPKGNEKTLYRIGQFIIQEHRRDSSVFDEIMKMTKGFFVSTALFSEPTEPISSKFKNTTIYLDTRVVLCALGYHTPEEHETTIQLIEMLREQNASLACFDHTMDEIRSVLRAYRQSLYYQEGKNPATHPTLEGLDASGCTPNKVTTIITSLNAKVHALGISIAEGRCESGANACLVNEQKLRDDLKGVNYRNDKALERDVLSIASVCRLRGDARASSVERCGALFITNNTRVKRIANRSVGADGQDDVPPVMISTELGAMIWLKAYSAYGDYPRRKLVEDATLALYPTESIMRAFDSAVDDALGSEAISIEEYEAIKCGLFQRRVLMSSIDGDESNVGVKTVVDIRNSMRESILGENSAALEVARAEAHQSREEIGDARRRALQNIEAAGNKRFESVRRVGRLVIWILLIAIAIASAFAIISDLGGEHTSLSWCTVFLLTLDLVGMCDLVFGKYKFLYKLVDLLAQKCGDRAKDLERSRYRNVFPNGQSFF